MLCYVKHFLNISINISIKLILYLDLYGNCEFPRTAFPHKRMEH